MKVKPKSYITIKVNKVAEVHTTTTAKIVLPNAVLLRFVMIIPIIGASRKDQAWFHAKNNVNLYTETHFNIEENACLLWNLLLRPCLDFNGYFNYCKSENTRANHPYKMQTKSAKVLSPLSTPFCENHQRLEQSTKPPL